MSISLKDPKTQKILAGVIVGLAVLYVYLLTDFLPFTYKARAAELDDWIKSQDNKADMTVEEKLTWEAQRAVWIEHAKSLRRVAQRLAATRGTKRKVRILAKEISDSLQN